jgi:transcriptional regulator with XRE-family HTH domain
VRQGVPSAYVCATVPGVAKTPPPFNEWLTKRMGATRPAELSRATGIPETNISRWLRGTAVPDLDNCRKLAHGLERPVLEVMVYAGHISPAEASLKELVPPSPIITQMQTPEGRVVATLTDRADAQTRKLIADMVRRLTGEELT